MLMPLNKIAEEIGVQESEAIRLATYAGLRRERGGYYDDGQFLRIYVKFLHEKLYSFAAVEPTVDEKPKKSARRVRVAAKHKRATTPWAGTLLQR
jgi:hypothetical protein